MFRQTDGTQAVLREVQADIEKKRHHGRLHFPCATTYLRDALHRKRDRPESRKRTAGTFISDHHAQPLCPSYHGAEETQCRKAFAVICHKVLYFEYK